MTGVQLQEIVPSEGNSEGYEPPASTEFAGYYNMDIIPNTQIFFPPRNLPVATNSTTANSKTILKSKGIYSSDPKLDQNADELWRFLVSNLQSPTLFVRIEGTHTKVTNAMDSLQTSVATDFSMQIDVSKYVNPRWSRMVTRPFRKDVATPTVREILEEYARCRNASKKFCLMKMVGWNFDELTELLADLVRFTGYQSEVTITYLVPDYKVVVAHSGSAPVKGIVSWLTSGLVWPGRASASKRFKNRLVCEYSMESSAHDFFAERPTEFTMLCGGGAKRNTWLLWNQTQNLSVFEIDVNEVTLRVSATGTIVHNIAKRTDSFPLTIGTIPPKMPARNFSYNRNQPIGWFSQ